MVEDRVIILRDCRVRDHYSVHAGWDGRGPWYEGSEFRPSDLGKIKGHYFVNHHFVDGNGEGSDIVVNIAHNKRELSDKIYESAREYCEKSARETKAKFIDDTKRRKQIVLSKVRL